VQEMGRVSEERLPKEGEREEGWEQMGGREGGV